MLTANPMPTPMVSTIKLFSHDQPETDDPSLYRSVIGGLQYVTITQLDLPYALNKVCQSMHSPKETHWKFVKRIMRYLQGTAQFGLTMLTSKNLHLAALCDVYVGSVMVTIAARL